MNLDPAIGSELRKTRPVVVMSIAEAGKLPLRIVVPLTDWKPRYAAYPWFVFIPVLPGSGLAKDSGADGFQVKSLSVVRFQQKVGEVPPDYIAEIAASIVLCVGYKH